MMDTNCIDNNLDSIHPCTTKPLDLDEKPFMKLSYLIKTHQINNISYTILGSITNKELVTLMSI
jgi:hypothetical protein